MSTFSPTARSLVHKIFQMDPAVGVPNRFSMGQLVRDLCLWIGKADSSVAGWKHHPAVRRHVWDCQFGLPPRPPKTNQPPLAVSRQSDMAVPDVSCLGNGTVHLRGLVHPEGLGLWRPIHQNSSTNPVKAGAWMRSRPPVPLGSPADPSGQ